MVIVGTWTLSRYASAAMMMSRRSTPASAQTPSTAATITARTDPAHTRTNSNRLFWMTRSITWNAWMKLPSSRLLRPGMTTTAKANRKPATSEHRNSSRRDGWRHHRHRAGCRGRDSGRRTSRPRKCPHQRTLCSCCLRQRSVMPACVAVRMTTFDLLTAISAELTGAGRVAACSRGCLPYRKTRRIVPRRVSPSVRPALSHLHPPLFSWIP